MTNQQNKNAKKRDDTLEHLAIPLFASMQIERQDEIQFALSVYKKIIEITNLSDDQPKNYYYSQFLLLKFIEERSLYHYSQNKSSASADDDEKIQVMKKNKEKFDLLS